MKYVATLFVITQFFSFAKLNSNAISADAQTKDLVNSLRMQVTLVQPGEFHMGSEDSIETILALSSIKDREGHESEFPRHRVLITKAFYIGIYEVTIGEFRQFVEDSGYRTHAEKDPRGGGGYDVSLQDTLFSDEKFNWKSTGFPQTDNHPVVNVNWYDATEFCRWLSKREQRKYRLPTEAEWEYCCRGGTVSRFPCGTDLACLVKIGNIWDASTKVKFPKYRHQLNASDQYPFTAPVGQFEKNGFGVYDMIGNVNEWCFDWNDEKYYQGSPLRDPRGPEKGDRRVVRGGDWMSQAAHARSAARSSLEPEAPAVTLGFRVVMETD